MAGVAVQETDYRGKMITVTEIVTLYTYDELSETAQNKAVDETINSWMECENLVPEDALEAFKNAGLHAERMLTPWFWGSYIWDYCKDFVLAECAKGYYQSDGEFYMWIDQAASTQ